MRRLSIFVFALSVLPPLVGEPFDRIAVTVGQHVIAESDIVLDLRCAAFIDGRMPDLSGAAKRKSAERLVDQYLILADAASVETELPPAAAAEPLLAPIRARYAADAEYRAALARAQITEGDLRDHLLTGLWLLGYTDTRFRPEVQVSDEDLQAAYEKFVAQKSGGKTAVPDFEAVRPQLEQLLLGQRSTEALDRWLAMARQEARIRYHDAAF